MDDSLDEFELLVKRAVEGEVGALTQLLTSQQAWLGKFIASRLDRRLAPRLDVGDVVQEVLVEVAGKFPEYVARSPIPFVAWIKQITLERLSQVHRLHVVAGKRSVRREVSVPDSDGWSSDTVSGIHPRSKDKTPSSYVAGKELYSEVARLMKHLSESDQGLLRMRFIEQLSTKEVAAALGLSEKAVRMRQLRALRQLRDLIEPRGPGSDGE